MTALLVLLFLLAVPSMAQNQPQTRDPDLARWRLAQKYAAKGFKPVDCFAGQVKVRGKRVAQQPFSIFKANDEMRCCGPIVERARTDKHGHFLIEPMKEGEYFAQFEFGDVQYITNFAVIQSYARCEETGVEINFLDVDKAQVQTYVHIDDSGEPCKPAEPHCFRK